MEQAEGSGLTPRTILRRRYEQSCELDEQGRLHECVEYLENPEILVSEFADSFLTAEAFDQRDEGFCAEGQARIPMRRWSDQVVQSLIEADSVTVLDRVPYVFRYVAREILPLWTQRTASERRGRRAAGLHYVGLVEGDELLPVLGVVRPREDRGSYLSLLRLLTCLAEVSTEAQMERANRFLFKGALPSRPSFDLHIVGAGECSSDRGEPLTQLTRDLAHAFATRLKEEWQFPDLVRNVSCLVMDTADFDGMLRVDWSV